MEIDWSDIQEIAIELYETFQIDPQWISFRFA